MHRADPTAAQLERATAHSIDAFLEEVAAALLRVRAESGFEPTFELFSCCMTMATRQRLQRLHRDEMTADEFAAMHAMMERLRQRLIRFDEQFVRLGPNTSDSERAPRSEARA